MPQVTTRAALTKGREIAAGGEGKIYEHPTNKDMVVKVYHQTRGATFVNHLERLKSLSLAGAFTMRFVAPLNIYIDKQGSCLGFDMQYVNFNDYYLFNNLFNKGFCNSNGIDKAFKITLLKQLSDCLQMLHKRKTIIGDLNQYNIFFSKKDGILFVDVDSYSTDDSPPSGVLLDDIRDWTTMDINESTDIWAYDILAFWATTFCHPFKWVAPGNKESLEQRVKAHKSILIANRIVGLKLPALYEPPQGDVLKQFEEIFNGRRYIVDFSGVHVPVSTIIKQPIASQTLIVKELYDHVTHVHACDNYVTIRTNDIVPKWSLLDCRIAKMVKLDFEVTNWEEIYPSNNKPAYRIGNELFSSDGQWSKTFIQPTWDYNDGCLTVVDYATDMQWNFNLNNQLGGLDCTSTPVFAKSIIKRTGNLQNFGSQKFLNAPMNNRYTLIPVHAGTQDAFKVKNYKAEEIKTRSRIKFCITNTQNNNEFFELDYLPKFAVTIDNKGVVLVPDDGFIQVYVKGQYAMKFDCGICTQNSALYCTTAGILMLENNQLYLLNTK